MSATFFVGVPPVAFGDIILSEINYHPPAPTAQELAANATLTDNDFEFLELWNISDHAIDLAGAHFVAGIQFVYPQHALPVDGRLILARNPQAFRLRYPEIPERSIVGPFAGGQLDNGGEVITLHSAQGLLLADVEYSDERPWDTAADGVGSTLEWLGATQTQQRMNAGWSRWDRSLSWGGTPGTSPVSHLGVVISEVLATSQTEQRDAIELHNRTSQTINIGGWYLSDDSDNLWKYLIPHDTVLQPDARRVFDENDFNPTPSAPLPHHFFLDENGNDVWLTARTAEGTLRWIVDHTRVGPTSDGGAWGGSNSARGVLVPQNRVTLGCVNSSTRVGPVIITELLAAPPLPSAAALAVAPRITSDDLEFIELHNPTLQQIDLSQWELRGDISTSLPHNTTLAPNETIVIVSFDPQSATSSDRVAAFRAQYQLAPTVRLVGGYSGQLNDSGGIVELLRNTAATGVTPATFVNDDLVLHSGGSPTDLGRSVTRRGATLPGDVASTWASTMPTPGVAQFAVNLRGDISGDGLVDTSDIDALVDAIHAQRALSHFDLDGDNDVDWDDRKFLQERVLNLLPGDANGDGRVDGIDLAIWQRNQFQGCRSTWSDGDWNGDRVVDGSDWNQWNEHKFQLRAGAVRAASVIHHRGTETQRRRA